MSRPKLRTVLVDDSADLRDLLAVALEGSGRFEVVGSAADGAAGVAMASASSPDLVLLDLGMQGGGGLEVLPRLRAASPASMVVVMSGYPRQDMERRVTGLGAAGYVEKGMSLREFVDRVIAAAGVLELVQEALDVLASERTDLEQDLRSGSKARRFVAEALERWDCSDALDTVQLLVSEVVTNAVVHAGSRPTVAVILLPEAVRIEVADDNPVALAPRDANDDDESGRGLLLLDSMASRWGVEGSEHGKTVWFEVARFDA
jgi:DNA-binding NarL/FixJ family response regulator